jgi:hypothetical protein
MLKMWYVEWVVLFGVGADAGVGVGENGIGAGVVSA